MGGLYRVAARAASSGAVMFIPSEILSSEILKKNRGRAVPASSSFIGLGAFVIGTGLLSLHAGIASAQTVSVPAGSASTQPWDRGGWSSRAWTSPARGSSPC
jgi:hypothetical protein